MERSPAQFAWLGMALCLLPLLVATAGERAWQSSPIARAQQGDDSWHAQALVVGVTLVQAAAHEPLASSYRDHEVGPRWRRTALGWERAELWRMGPLSQPTPVFDPILFAALQCMLSLMALIAWPEG
jgi:hypothetical protein